MDINQGHSSTSILTYDIRLWKGPVTWGSFVAAVFLLNTMETMKPSKALLHSVLLSVCLRQHLCTQRPYYTQMCELPVSASELLRWQVSVISHTWANFDVFMSLKILSFNMSCSNFGFLFSYFEKVSFVILWLKLTHLIFLTFQGCPSVQQEMWNSVVGIFFDFLENFSLQH